MCDSTYIEYLEWANPERHKADWSVVAYGRRENEETADGERKCILERQKYSYIMVKFEQLWKYTKTHWITYFKLVNFMVSKVFLNKAAEIWVYNA